MNPKEHLIKNGLKPWMAKFMVKKIASSLNENKFEDVRSDIDKPVGGQKGKKDIFRGK